MVKNGGGGRDPLSAPFGAFAPPPMLARLRAIVVSSRGPYFLKRWLYKLFTHFTKKRGIIIDTEYLGGKFRLFIDENGQDRWVFRRGYHPEHEEFLIFEEHANTGCVFIDIGANNGYFAVLSAIRLGPDARILSFEPHPRTFEKLKMNLAFNQVDTVEAINCALGPSDSIMTLRVSNAADGCNSLAGGDGDGVGVKVTPLVSALAARSIDRVDILKIDVEGFEDEVLFPFFETAPEALWPSRIIIEKTNKDAIWRRDCFELLKRCGYVVTHETLDNAWLSRELNTAAPPRRSSQ